ncbi:hypothetical protein MMC30_006082 [Trapelia coarctata]|nr:hypothetical protein [Trapelia coarctata]
MPLVKVNSTTRNEEWGDWGYTLRAIAENRRVGWYVKNVEVVEELRHDWGNYPAGIVTISRSCLEPIWPLLRDSTYLTAHERIEWYSSTLGYFSWGWRDPYIARMLDRTGAASQGCAQETLSEILSVGVSQDSQPADPASPTFLKTWAALPSVVEIYIHGVMLTGSLSGAAAEAECVSSFEEASAESHPADSATATQSHSGVTHLFSKCDIESLYLSPFLRYFHNLRSFESTLTKLGTDEAAGWSPRFINETLQQYSKHKLEELRITRDTTTLYPATFDTFIGSLASFHALKTVILQLTCSSPLPPPAPPPSQLSSPSPSHASTSWTSPKPQTHPPT